MIHVCRQFLLELFLISWKHCKADFIISVYIRRSKMWSKGSASCHWNSLRFSSEAENLWKNLMKAKPSFPINHVSHTSVGGFCYKLKKKNSVWNRKRLYDFQTLVAHRTSGRRCRKLELRLANQEEMSKPTLQRCLVRNPLLHCTLSCSLDCYFWNLVLLKPELPPQFWEVGKLYLFPSYLCVYVFKEKRKPSSLPAQSVH